MKLRRVLGSISNLSTERLSFSSSRCPSQTHFHRAVIFFTTKRRKQALGKVTREPHQMGVARFSQKLEVRIWGFTPLQPKPLDSIMDLERAKTKSPEELTSIWDDDEGHIGMTMKAQLYRLLEQRAAECRYFVIPLWRGNGYVTMFAQD